MSEAKVIALTNQKGGVGKTTTSVSLGVGLANQGKKVLLIDADAQGSLSLSLGVPFPDDLPHSLSNILQNVLDDKPIDISQGIIKHKEGVDLMPGNVELSGVELRMVGATNREQALKTYTNQIKHKYDYILIDCSPSLGVLTINAMTAADSIIIPSQPHFLSTKGLELLLKSVGMIKKQINPKLKIDGILMTMVNSRTNFSKDIISILRGKYGEQIKIFDTEIPLSIRAVETSAEGKSIYAFDKGSKIAQAYENLTKEILNIEKQRTQNRTQGIR